MPNYKCINNKRHYYRGLDKKCYKCKKTKEENDTRIGKTSRYVGVGDSIGLSRYDYMKAWRIKYPERRYQERKEYYDRHKQYDALSKQRYTEKEKEIVLTKLLDNKHLTDVEIAKFLERSVRAIQVLRTKLVKMKGVKE